MALLAAWLPLLAANAQASHSTDSTTTRFKVSGFKVLPNDISAFITPVRDLNGDACALVKVVAQKEFAFSSPLGIVKRKNEVGEIWLYLPHGTKLLTIKHPRWGVLRDYRFYADDLVHPAPQAIAYVWEKFIPAVLDDKARRLLPEVESIVAAAAHRPRNPRSEAHHAFCRRQLERIAALPEIDFQRESALFRQSIEINS